MKYVRHLLASSLVRKWAMVLVMLATFAAFVYYFASHPVYIHVLSHISFWIIPPILLLNAGVLLTVSAITATIVSMCGVKMAYSEQFLLTSYSSIVNFFGLLQSGPGFRAIYLKTRHNVRLRDFALGMLVYYTIFAAISALFLLGPVLPVWETLLAVSVVLVASSVMIRLHMKRIARSDGPALRLSFGAVTSLFILALLQTSFVAGYYFIELRAVSRSVTLVHAIIYTGAANFALFVALTPDAIGIRESFLALTIKLHHIPVGVILAANLIDRAVYVLFLALLFTVALGLNARTKLGITEFSKDKPPVAEPPVS
jgi:hypothetical protein